MRKMRSMAEDLEVGDIIWHDDSWHEIVGISVNMAGNYILALHDDIFIVAPPGKKFLLM